jgi:hypothetical protein
MLIVYYRFEVEIVAEILSLRKYLSLRDAVVLPALFYAKETKGENRRTYS